MMRDCVGARLDLTIGDAALATHQRHLSTEMTGGVDEVIVQERYRTMHQERAASTRCSRSTSTVNSRVWSPPGRLATNCWCRSWVDITPPSAMLSEFETSLSPAAACARHLLSKRATAAGSKTFASWITVSESASAI